MSTVTLKPDGLYIDDKRFDMLSGDIHYFRIYPGGLRRRLEYAKAFGLNTIQTYCPWNLHEPKKGEFNFSGMLDLKGFLELADEMGFVIPFKKAKEADNPLVKIATDYVDAGKKPVSWNFATIPSDDWKGGVGAALTQYAAGTGTWDDVKTAFVDGWRNEYNKVNG